MAALHLGLLSVAPTFDGQRERTKLQERAAARSAVLRGRQAEVVQSWEQAMAGALAARGVEADLDVLAAVGATGFRTAVTRWLRESGALADHLDAVVAALAR